MIEVIFLINDTIAPRVRDKFCQSYNFNGTNAEKLAFVKARTIEFWKDRIRMVENPPLAQGAINQNNVDIDNLDIT